MLLTSLGFNSKGESEWQHCYFPYWHFHNRMGTVHKWILSGHPACSFTSEVVDVCCVCWEFPGSLLGPVWLSTLLLAPWAAVALFTPAVSWLEVLWTEEAFLPSGRLLGPGWASLWLEVSSLGFFALCQEGSSEAEELWPNIATCDDISEDDAAGSPSASFKLLLAPTAATFACLLSCVPTYTKNTISQNFRIL
jgi:hypothetical protein